MAEGILPAITLVNAGIVGRNFLRKPSSQKHRLSPACFLDVYDLPTSSGPSYQVPVLQTSTRHEDDVTSALDRLSEQEPNKIRVFINEFDEDGMTGHLFSRLQSAGPLHPQVSPGGRNSKSGIKALMSQWRGTRSDEWYRSDGWDYLTHEDMLDPRVRAQGPLRRQMSELRRDIKELAGLSDEQWVFTLKHYRVEDNNGCLRGKGHALNLLAADQYHRLTSPKCSSQMRPSHTNGQFNHVSLLSGSRRSCLNSSACISP
jgi:hypothetical protein